MVVSQKWGDPNIDPKILQSVLKGPQNGTPNFGKPPYLSVRTHDMDPRWPTEVRRPFARRVYWDDGKGNGKCYNGV